jgi:hypothetical protein
MEWKTIYINVPDLGEALYYPIMSLKFRLKGKSVRDWMTWGTYGKSGKDPLMFVILKNMSDEHIEAILRTQPHIKGFYENQFRKELKRRERNPKLSIKETF